MFTLLNMVEKNNLVVQYNNHNAGELLILVFIESNLGNNRSDDCGYIRQPVIAWLWALGGFVLQL